MADLAASFAKPFDLQIAALRLRLANQVGTAAWDDLIKAQHDRAFVVAGAMKADLLADLGKAVERAIGQHRSIETFRQEFREIVTEHGWHGWTGEGTAKGEAWRTKVIYRTNMATSYAAGRFAQLKAAGYRFWVYKHGNAVEPRLQHLAWDGLALPPDHPFWETHAPPNGWGCTCRIRGADSERGIRRAGGDPGKALPEGWDAINAKTGEPPGIDKGWGYAPGNSVADELKAFIEQKAASLPIPLANDMTAELAKATTSIVPQSPVTVDDAIVLGQRVIADLRRRNAQLSADWDAGKLPLAASALREDLHRYLAASADFGGQAITLVRGARAEAKAIMQDVALRMPTDWVKAGNSEPIAVKVLLPWERGEYRPKSSDTSAKIFTSVGSTAVHEYLHHLQFTLPSLDRLFRDLHLRRTANEALTRIYPDNPDELARKDGYYNAYQGKEYPYYGPMEVLTMALQPLLGTDDKSMIMLKSMLEKDPEMLEFALGMLLYWRP